MSFRPRSRVSGAAIGGAQRLPFAASRHACMQACTSRNASCQRRTCTAAESRGRTIGNGVTSGNKMERNKKGVPFPDGMYRGLNFILPWKTCRVLSYLLRKKEKKTENEGLQAFRPPRSRPDVSVTKSIGSILSDLHLRARQCVCVSSRGQETEKEAELELEEEEGEVKRNSLTDWRTRGGRRGEWRA